MKNRILTASVAPALATIMLMPGIAGAAQPVTSTTSFNNPGIVLENYCSDGIDLQTSSVGEFRTKDFFDRNGVLIRSQTQASVNLSFSLSSTEERLKAKVRYSLNRNQLTGQRDFTGITFKLNVPGEGGVDLTIGRQVFDDAGEEIFIAGQVSAPITNFDFVCEYLGHLG